MPSAGFFDGLASKGGVLSDGETRLPYAEIGAWFDRFRHDLAGVAPGDRIGLVCRSTTPSVAALLHLLAGDRACFLAPDEAIARAPFCRFVADASVEAGRPNLAVRENPSFAGSAPASGVAVRTSGSVGRPKIALFSHKALIENARACVQRFGLAASDRVAVPVPVFHMYGLGAALLPAVLAGASVDVQGGSNALRFVARERSFDTTVAYATPSLCQSLLLLRRAPRPYRFTVVAGDRFPEPALRQYEERHGPVVPLYGSTELGAIAAGSPADDLASRAATAGRPLEGMELRTRLDEDGRSELLVRASHGFSGYLDDAGRLSAPALDDGFHRTNDLAQLRSSGEVELLGRKDHAVKRDGMLVMLADVEAVLAAIEGVARACVVLSGKTTRRGAELVAFCAVDPNGPLDEPRLRQRAAERLPGHALPDRFVPLKELPALGSGKIDRRALGILAAET